MWVIGSSSPLLWRVPSLQSDGLRYHGGHHAGITPVSRRLTCRSVLRTIRSWVSVLGPLRIDGVDTSLGRRDQVVLSALAVRTGEVVPADRLAEALWGEAPPPSWPKVVQGCVVRLRRVVGQPLIETTPTGYRLVADGDELDSHRFEQLIDRAQGLAGGGEHDRAAVMLARALELWRGTPFVALDGWIPGRTESARLEEMRRSAEERVLDALLETGDHRNVVGLAQARVAEEPLRVHRWATLALAQYRCGHQADALRSLKQARHALVEQLGIEPGQELVELESAILRQDVGLLASVVSPTASGQCPYRGLVPYDVEDTEAFFGRTAEVEACMKRLGTSPLLVVTGSSGCGKSSLVRAGIVPALARSGRSAAVFVPGADPESALAHAQAAAVGTPVLVVDQFEELFLLDDGATGRARSFCARLAEYAAPHRLRSSSRCVLIASRIWLPIPRSRVSPNWACTW